MRRASIMLPVLAAVHLSACGGGGGGKSNPPTPSPPQSPAPPTVTLSADRNSVLTGQAVVLSWTSTGARSCTASSGWTGSKATTGTESVASAVGSSTYIMTCENAGGTVNSSVTVTASSPVVSGRLFAPDGSTPITGATVYAATQPVSSLGKLRANRQAKDDQAACAEPSAPNSGFTCTGADGSFSFTASAVSGNTISLVFEKGMFRMTQTVTAAPTVAAGDVRLPKETAQGAPRIAVVTGSYDRIEVILAKLGLASYDSNTEIIDFSTAAFTMFDGDGLGQFDAVTALFELNPSTSLPRIRDFDIVFVNCGADLSSLDNAENRAAVRAYVQNGGVLYATDWGYDAVEQSIPEYLRFVDEPDTDPTHPYAPGAATVGPDGISIDAAIRDPSLAPWLDGVTCISGPCRNGDGTIRVEGFLSGWAVMEGAHSAHADDVFEYVGGTVPLANSTQERPLSVAFPFDAGQVIYSSYHTVHEGAAGQGFYPQERVLQYLVFEAGE